MKSKYEAMTIAWHFNNIVEFKQGKYFQIAFRIGSETYTRPSLETGIEWYTYSDLINTDMIWIERKHLSCSDCVAVLIAASNRGCLNHSR